MVNSSPENPRTSEQRKLAVFFDNVIALFMKVVAQYPPEAYREYNSRLNQLKRQTDAIFEEGRQKLMTELEDAREQAKQKG